MATSTSSSMASKRMASTSASVSTSSSSSASTSTMTSYSASSASASSLASQLAAVKRDVKSWERTWRAQHEGRVPSPAEIRADRGGIAAKYSLYKRLSKAVAAAAAAASSSSAPPRSSSPPSTLPPPQLGSGLSYSSRQPADAAARRQRSPGDAVVDASSNPFLTSSAPPLPPPLLSSSSSRGRPIADATTLPVTPRKTPASRASPSLGTPRGPGDTGQAGSANPFLSPSVKTGRARSSSRRLSSSTGVPLVDRNAAAKQGDDAAPSTPSRRPAGAGPTIMYASSPSRLRQLLAAASPRAQRKQQQQQQQHAADLLNATAVATPRTKARKRLRGELVDDTPPPPPLRSRPHAKQPLASSREDVDRQMPESVVSTGDSGGDLDSDDEEVLGGTPVKPRDVAAGLLASVERVRHWSAGAKTTAGNHQDEDEDEDVVMSTPSRSRSRTQRVSGPASGQRLFAADAGDADSGRKRKRERDEDDEEREATPEPVIVTAHLPEESAPSPASVVDDRQSSALDTLVHEIELSSDDDSDDPNDPAVPIQHRTPRKLRIESHRYAQAVRARLPKTEATTSPSPPGSPAAGDISIASLSLLASPDAARLARRTFALHETRARGVFDPEVERRAKLAKRMEAVYLAGEDGQEERDEDDDDWDEEPDGWKAVGVPEDDDW